ncbi:O-methyltransferase [Chryseobacterium sp. A301]
MSYFEENLPEMDRYLEQHASKEPALLNRLRRETYQKTTQPHMISGYQQGRFLSMISQLKRPKTILEVGTFTGYATLCLAEGLAPDGKIVTLDINEDLAYLPKSYFEQSELANRIEFRLENAIKYLKNTDQTFDLVFIDADKENYVTYFELIKPKLNPGAILLFDNVLWYGKVLETEPTLKSTRVIQQLNDMLAKDEGFENLILPLRDGVHVAIKK